MISLYTASDDISDDLDKVLHFASLAASQLVASPATLETAR